MRKIDTDELKQIQLDILVYVDKFCRENGIQYWLDGGTLLGAIRHQGYIPWDDDIDIGMLRKDYDRFAEIFNSKSNIYRFFNIDNTKGFYCAYGKVADTKTKLHDNISDFYINIDIFVYDNAPDNDKVLKKMYDRCDLLRKWYFRQKAPVIDESLCRKFIKEIMHMVLQVIPEDYFMTQLTNNSKQYAQTESGFIGNFTGLAKIKADKTIFSSFIEVTFEGKSFFAPARYDEWLALFYHDYMQLPPKEKQVSHHVFDAYVED